MRNIKLTISYDGTRYSGWQSQKNARSIQEALEKRLCEITGERVTLKGSGRTDAGVHAAAQVANFKTRSRIPAERLRAALNSYRSKDIVVTKAEDAPLGFDSQKSAKSKTYRYSIANADFVDPFVRHFAARCFYRLDAGKMRRAASLLKGRHDLRSFQTVDGRKGSSVRTIKRIRITRKKALIYVDIEADGFLYNMARSIVGTLVEAGRGKITPEEVKRILDARDRRLSGPTMPAKGLCLMKVTY